MLWSGAMTASPNMHCSLTTPDSIIQNTLTLPRTSDYIPLFLHTHSPLICHIYMSQGSILSLTLCPDVIKPDLCVCLPSFCLCLVLPDSCVLSYPLSTVCQSSHLTSDLFYPDILDLFACPSLKLFKLHLLEFHHLWLLHKNNPLCIDIRASPTLIFLTSLHDQKVTHSF